MMRAVVKIDDRQIAEMDLDITFRMKVREWREIGSAPKDGTHILLVDAEDNSLTDRGVCVGWWRSGEWRDYGDLGCNQQVDYAPTHWMPLPESPIDSIKRDGLA